MKRTRTLYIKMGSVEKKLAGGEGDLAGFYGSTTETGTTLGMEFLLQHAGMGPNSVLVDFGAGLGRPLLHAAYAFGIPTSYGIEVDPVKCMKANAFKRIVHANMASEGFELAESALPRIICSCMKTVESIQGATHVWACWQGQPHEVKQAGAKLFAASSTARAIVVVQNAFPIGKEEEEMKELGFGNLRLVTRFPMTLTGSGGRLMGYGFVRDTRPVGAPVPNSTLDMATLFTEEMLHGGDSARARRAAKRG